MDPKKDKINTPLAGELPETKVPAPEPTETVVIDLTQNKDYSHLPVGTQTSIELDKKNLATNTTNVAPITSDNKIVKNGVQKLDISKRFLKISGIFAAIAIGCLIILLLISSTNIDTQVIKITLTGRVLDRQTNEPIENAVFSINQNEVARSNANGEYSIPGLNSGDVTVNISADGYQNLTESTRVGRVLLDYTTRKDFLLESSLVGSLSGKFVANDPTYNFLNDKLTVGDREIDIKEDGSFSGNVPSGDVNFLFESINFRNIQRNIKLEAGSNTLEDIALETAGDIVGELKSYVKEDLVLNTKFFVENILQDQVDISQDGKFAIKDLDVEREYRIRVTADGYNTRDYLIRIRQGENQLFNFKLVEEGSAFFLRRQAEGGNAPIFLYRSDFDGENESLITNYNIDAFSRFYSIEENRLYYQSSFDNAYRQTGNSGRLNMPYIYNPETSVTERLTINTTNLAELRANFVAKKMLNISVLRVGNQNKPQLQVMNIDGNNRQEVRLVDLASQSFDNLRISDNGAFVFYSIEENDVDQLNRYSIDSSSTTLLISGEDITLFDVSTNGELVLASRRNPNTGLIDLVLFNTTTNDLRTLRENIKGTDYQFLKGDTNKVIFFERRESRYNIYSFSIDRSLEERTSSLTPDYEIKDIYQESNLLYYLTNRGLLVMDLNSPKNFKLVSNNVLDYTE